MIALAWQWAMVYGSLTVGTWFIIFYNPPWGTP